MFFPSGPVKAQPADHLLHGTRGLNFTGMVCGVLLAPSAGALFARRAVIIIFDWTPSPALSVTEAVIVCVPSLRFASLHCKVAYRNYLSRPAKLRALQLMLLFYLCLVLQLS